VLREMRDLGLLVPLCRRPLGTFPLLCTLPFSCMLARIIGASLACAPDKSASSPCSYAPARDPRLPRRKVTRSNAKHSPNSHLRSTSSQVHAALLIQSSRSNSPDRIHLIESSWPLYLTRNEQQTPALLQELRLLFSFMN
jgi:hypothetical protein